MTVNAIRLALQHKGDLAALSSPKDTIELQQGCSVGAVVTVYQLAKRLGTVAALGSSRQGKLALWKVIARVIDQGSRPSAVRLAMRHAAREVTLVGDRGMIKGPQPLIGDWPHPYLKEDAFYPMNRLRDDEYWPPVDRIDNVYSDRFLVCSCPPLEVYQEAAE